MANCCSILAWKIPWKEEPSRLQSMGPQRVRHSEQLSTRMPYMAGICEKEPQSNIFISSYISSVAQLCLTICDPMNHSTPGLPVHHQLPKYTQTHVLLVGDAIQPSHPLLPLLLLPSIFPSIRVFSNESALQIRWPKYRSFSFNISPSNEHPGHISFRMDWLDVLAVHGLSRVFSNTTVQKHQFFVLQLSL